jgi:hypothetical protein
MAVGTVGVPNRTKIVGTIVGVSVSVGVNVEVAVGVDDGVVNNAVWVKAALAVSTITVLMELGSKVGTGAGVGPRVGTQANITAVIKSKATVLLFLLIMIFSKPDPI